MNTVPREAVSHGTKEFPFAYYRMEHVRPTLLVPLHWHEEIEVLYIERGKLSLTIGDSSYEGQAGDVFWVNPGEIHGMSSDDNSLRYHAFVFPLRFASFQVRAGKELYLPLSEGRLLLSRRIPERIKKEAVRIVRRLLLLYTDKTPGFAFGMQICCAQLLYTLYTDGCYEKLPPADSVLAMKREILKYLQDNFTEKLSLRELADTFHLSEKYFSRYFKKNFRMTLTDYVNSLRLENAARLLADTDLSVTEAAMQSGFNNVSYFIRCFEKSYGCSPLRYRRENAHQ